jgi:hypothetical protein
MPCAWRAGTGRPRPCGSGRSTASGSPTQNSVRPSPCCQPAVRRCSSSTWVGLVSWNSSTSRWRMRQSRRRPSSVGSRSSPRAAMARAASSPKSTSPASRNTSHSSAAASFISRARARTMASSSCSGRRQTAQAHQGGDLHPRPARQRGEHGVLLRLEFLAGGESRSSPSPSCAVSSCVSRKAASARQRGSSSLCAAAARSSRPADRRHPGAPRQSAPAASTAPARPARGSGACCELLVQHFLQRHADRRFRMIERGAGLQQRAPLFAPRQHRHQQADQALGVVVHPGQRGATALAWPEASSPSSRWSSARRAASR